MPSVSYPFFARLRSRISTQRLQPQLVAKWCLLKGASRIIAIDNVQWRLDNVREKLGSKVELLNFDEFKNVPKKLNEMTAPGTHGLDPTRPAGIDVALECAAGEYAKGWGHAIEMALGLGESLDQSASTMLIMLLLQRRTRAKFSTR